MPEHLSPASQMFAEAAGRAPGRDRLPGRRVLVVGAGQRRFDGLDVPLGNGRAIALLAAREGARLACADVDAAAVAETAALVAGAGGTAHAIVADVADPDQIARMVAEADAALGGLDGLVMNVGVSGGKPLGAITPESWDWELGINLRGHVLACQAALPRLAEGSAIVLMSSLASALPIGRNPAYEASKAALAAVTRSVALAGEPRGIRCNAVAPGLIDTPMGRVASQRRADRAKRVPFGRQGTAWEVAYATLFLLCNEASYVNAQTLFVDGGLGSGIAR